MSKREYMTGTELGEKILESIRQIKAGKTGRVTELVSPDTASAAARLETGLSQVQFARLMGVSVRTLQEWEQGRRVPSGAAQTLLQVATRHPDVLRELAV
jgi:putative transcriptional regulator